MSPHLSRLRKLFWCFDIRVVGFARPSYSLAFCVVKTTASFATVAVVRSRFSRFGWCLWMILAMAEGYFCLRMPRGPNSCWYYCSDPFTRVLRITGLYSLASLCKTSVVRNDLMRVSHAYSLPVLAFDVWNRHPDLCFGSRDGVIICSVGLTHVSVMCHQDC